MKSKYYKTELAYYKIWNDGFISIVPKSESNEEIVIISNDPIDPLTDEFLVEVPHNVFHKQLTDVIASMGISIGRK